MGFSSGLCAMGWVATRSCITPVEQVKNANIRTLEGLPAEDGALHPVQQAFIEQQVPQCGWCMGGQMMTAAAFLAENNDPTAEEIVAAMSENYCRCGCYVRIKTAVAQAATALREES